MIGLETWLAALLAHYVRGGFRKAAIIGLIPVNCLKPKTNRLAQDTLEIPTFCAWYPSVLLGQLEPQIHFLHRY